MPPARGQWVCPDGILFAERMIPVRIMADEQDMELIADMTANYYQQKAIMYYQISNKVTVKHYG